MLLAPGETADPARVGLCCQLCTSFNKKWPAGALILKEWELEVRGVVTTTQGQTQDAQGVGSAVEVWPLGFQVGVSCQGEISTKQTL